MSERAKCDVCKRSYYASLIGPCHKKPEKTVCMYCCVSKCGNGYRDDRGGVRCKVFDRKKAERGETEKP